MSPALRKASPRVTSAAISAADRRWLGGDSVGGGELVRDAAGGAAGSSAGASEVTGDGASATCGSGATTAGGKVAGRVVDSSTGESIASGGGEVVRDVAGGAAGSSAGASEVTGDGASATCGSGATTAGGKVAGRVVDSSTGESIASGGVGDGIASGVAIATISGGSEIVARRSASADGPPDLAPASGVSCPDEAMVPESINGSPNIATSWRDNTAKMIRVNSIPAATRLRTTMDRIARVSLARRRATSGWRRNSMPYNAIADVISAWPHCLEPAAIRCARLGVALLRSA